MYLQPYDPSELRFAYCCHVYYRWHTYFRRATPILHDLTKEDLESKYPEIHVLNIEASDTELALLASLRPSESVATAASKLKGATSKTLRVRLNLDRPEKLLGGGYFACTTGSNTVEAVDRYLATQSEHHGYDHRENPPVWSKTWPSLESGDEALRAAHSVTRLRWHLVFSTERRKGTFSREAAEAVTGCWEEQVEKEQIRFRKISWLPDHVHLAVRSHPSVVPQELVLILLNASQEVMREQFEPLLVRTGNRRLWQTRAYVGTYGDLANTQIQTYLRRWRTPA